MILALDPSAVSESASTAAELCFLLSARLLTGGRVSEYRELLRDAALAVELAKYSDGEVGARA